MFCNKKKHPKPAPQVNNPLYVEDVQLLDERPEADSINKPVAYLLKFCSRNRIVAPRKGIFVNRDLVHKLADYIQILGQGDASIGAYVEEIILDHLERNKETLDELFSIKSAHLR